MTTDTVPTPRDITADIALALEDARAAHEQIAKQEKEARELVDRLQLAHGALTGEIPAALLTAPASKAPRLAAAAAATRPRIHASPTLELPVTADGLARFKARADRLLTALRESDEPLTASMARQTLGLSTDLSKEMRYLHEQGLVREAGRYKGGTLFTAIPAEIVALNEQTPLSLAA